MLGAFTIAATSDKPGIVAIEDACDGRVAEDAEMVDLARMVFEALRSEAMNPCACSGCRLLGYSGLLLGSMLSSR